MNSNTIHYLLRQVNSLYTIFNSQSISHNFHISYFYIWCYPYIHHELFSSTCKGNCIPPHYTNDLSPWKSNSVVRCVQCYTFRKKLYEPLNEQAVTGTALLQWVLHNLCHISSCKMDVQAQYRMKLMTSVHELIDGIIYLVQVRHMTEVLLTPSSTWLKCARMTSKSWQYISCYWDTSFSHLVISDLSVSACGMPLDVLCFVLTPFVSDRWYSYHAQHAKFKLGLLMLDLILVCQQLCIHRKLIWVLRKKLHWEQLNLAFPWWNDSLN